jgi:hypothetical protein
VKISLCERYSGKALKEIGRYFNIGESGVSQASRGIAFKLSQNKQLTKKGEHNRGQVRLMKNEDLSPLSTRNG